MCLALTGEECHCGDWHGCIMSQSIVGLDAVQPYKFSECSLADYIDTLRVGHGICLFNRPNQVHKEVYIMALTTQEPDGTADVSKDMKTRQRRIERIY